MDLPKLGGGGGRGESLPGLPPGDAELHGVQEGPMHRH